MVACMAAAVFLLLDQRHRGARSEGGRRVRHHALRPSSEVDYQNKVFSGASAEFAFPCSWRCVGSSGTGGSCLRGLWFWRNHFGERQCRPFLPVCLDQACSQNTSHSRASSCKVTPLDRLHSTMPPQGRTDKQTTKSTSGLWAS